MPAISTQLSCRSKYLWESEDLRKTFSASPADHCQRLSVALLYINVQLPDVFQTL